MSFDTELKVLKWVYDTISKCFKNDGFISVSYTHLDVYKRQIFEIDCKNTNIKGILILLSKFENASYQIHFLFPKIKEETPACSNFSPVS